MGPRSDGAALPAVHVQTLYSGSGVAIITQPFLVGAELEQLAEAASMDFVRALPEDLGANVVSLEILNGGRYYHVADAYQAVRGGVCGVCAVRAKRYRRAGTGAWEVEVGDPMGSIDACTSLLVGDTVVTGTTLCGTLRRLLEVCALVAACARPCRLLCLFVVGKSDFKRLSTCGRGAEGSSDPPPPSMGFPWVQTTLSNIKHG